MESFFCLGVTASLTLSTQLQYKKARAVCVTYKQKERASLTRAGESLELESFEGSLNK